MLDHTLITMHWQLELSLCSMENTSYGQKFLTNATIDVVSKDPDIIIIEIIGWLH